MFERFRKRQVWMLLGYDAFAREWYPLRGRFSTELAAQRAAKKRLVELERTQPSAVSGGQAGIQDQVYIIRPDGTRYRYLPGELRELDENPL
jgi:hypothetical protein